MRENFQEQIDKEIQSIIDLLVKDGWHQEDSFYLEKETSYLVSPDSIKRKNTIGIVLYPKLLNYYEKRSSSEVSKIWTCVDVGISVSEEEAKNPWVPDRIKNICSFLVYSFRDRLTIHPFMDEDGFLNHFDRPKFDEDGYGSLKMYVNYSIPEGAWSNHTLS